MRRALSIAMVFLLVLRGLLGDAMAMGAAPMPGTQAVHAAEAHHHAPELAHALADGLVDGVSQEHVHSARNHPTPTDPAPMQAASCTDAGASGCGGHEHGSSCPLCGICHSALFTPAGIGARGMSSCTALRPQGSERFASAALLQAIKPPIS